jgi:hypothetical protein
VVGRESERPSTGENTIRESSGNGGPRMPRRPEQREALN